MNFREVDDQLESIRNSSTHTVVSIEDQIITVKYRITCFSGTKHCFFLNASMSVPQ